MESHQAVHGGGCVGGCGECMYHVCIVVGVWDVEDECVGTVVKVCVCVCIDRYSQFR